jgi:hypothetical protein
LDGYKRTTDKSFSFWNSLSVKNTNR